VKIRSVRKISRKGLSGENLGFFLAGFVEGEGSFNVSLRKKSELKKILELRESLKRVKGEQENTE
jgi:hypothetical protein